MSARIPSVRSMDSVKFENIKTSYPTDEDIIVVFVVDEQVRTSSRDWVGLFRKGWSSIQQYIVFEWTIGCPGNEIPPRRSVKFSHRTFVDNIELHEQYQFAYVSRYNKVLGMSPSFSFVAVVRGISAFTPSSEDRRAISESLKKDKLLVPTESGSGSGVLHSATPSQIPTKKFGSRLQHHQNNSCFSNLPLPGPVKKNSVAISEIVLKIELMGRSYYMKAVADKLKALECPKRFGTQFSSRKMATDVVEVLTHPDLPPGFLHRKNIVASVPKACSRCRRPTDYDAKLNRLSDKVVSMAEKVRSMESRISSLTSELELSRASQQKLRVTAEIARREKENYSRFVRQLLESLKMKGQMKLIDTEGNTIYVKSVSPEECRTPGSAQRMHRPACQVMHHNHSQSSVREEVVHQLVSELQQACASRSRENIAEITSSDKIVPLDGSGMTLHSSDMPAVSSKSVQEDNGNYEHCQHPEHQLPNSDSDSDATSEEGANGAQVIKSVAEDSQEDDAESDLRILFQMSYLS